MARDPEMKIAVELWQCPHGGLALGSKLRRWTPATCCKQWRAVRTFVVPVEEIDMALAGEHDVLAWRKRHGS